MITLTEKAMQKVNELLDKEGRRGEGLRLSVAGGGCSGFQYQIAFEEKPDGDDKVIHCDGFDVYIDSFSAPYLQGIEVDYVESIQGEGFKISNPNAASTCGCGQSFQGGDPADSGNSFEV